MAYLNHLFYGILILQINVHAAPGTINKLKVDIFKVEDLVDQHDTSTRTPEDGTASSESPRQKRYYNPYGFGFPSISPPIYPNFKRDVNIPVPSFGVDESLFEVQKRIQELADVVRQPQLPHHNPHVSPVPIFYPVLFVPQLDCACPPKVNESSPPTGNQPSPNVTNRFPEMEDERQNWGFVLNDTNENNSKDQGSQDFARPISFDPIRLNRPNARPAPPVEHGTLQSDATGNRVPQTGESNFVNTSPESNLPVPPPSASGNVSPFPSFRPPSRDPQPPSGAPTRCDGAILTCCHQPQVVYDCFVNQGCPTFTSYGNPCNTNTILTVIDKFQKFYGKRSG